MTEHATRRELSGWTFVLFGCWLGLVSGLLEATVLVGSKLWPNQFIRLGRDVGWMTPASEAVLLMTVAAACAVAVHLVGRDWAHRHALRLLLFLASGSIFASVASLHWYAVALLATGTAAQASRVVLRREAAAWAVARRTLPVLAAVVVATAAVTPLFTRGPEPGPSPRGLLSNVIVITLDTVAASHVSLTGYRRPTTPFLERLAGLGTSFERAIATSSWTLPSHASLFTGRYPNELSADWERPLDDAYPTLAEVLGRNGYRTGGFVANTIYCSYEHGLHRGFRRFSDFGHAPGQFVLSTALGRKLSARAAIRPLIGFYDVPGRKSAGQVSDEFLEWLGEDTARPFFAWLNYFDAHEPYLPPEPFAARFDRGRPRRLRQLSQRVGSAELDRKWELTRDEVEGEVDAYNGAIAYMDAQIERLVDALDRSKRLENTLLVITSDHGESFGEHGLFSHGNSLYMPTIHVPLLLVMPHVVPADRRIGTVVSLRDLPATVLDLVNIAGGGGGFQGTTLRSTWTGAADDRIAVSELSQPVATPARYPIAEGPMWSVVRHDLHYIRTGTAHEALFDLTADPAETESLAGQEEWRDELVELRQIAQRVQHGGASHHPDGPAAR